MDGTGMYIERKEWRWVVLATLLLVVASSLPYLIAWATTPEGSHFTGLLFNPQDGNSYIAKMRQGLEGSWLFRLPYTPESQDGAPVNLIFLFLGHVARWIGLPLIVVYHLARAFGGAAMLVMLYVLASRVTDDLYERRAMFLLAALGSGLGWLVVFFGYRSVDLGAGGVPVVRAASERALSAVDRVDGRSCVFGIADCRE